jgi:hypothetical protein
MCSTTKKICWRLRIDADIKKNLHTNKTLFLNQHLEEKTSQLLLPRNKTQKMPVQDWVID